VWGVIPGLNHPELLNGDTLVYSKGLGAQGLVFKDNKANEINTYLSTVKSLGIDQIIKSNFPNKVVHILGEVYGGKIQDLGYGRNTPNFACFDICVDGVYLNRDDILAINGINMVPSLYRGPFSKDIMYQYTTGSTVVGKGAHIREGIVIRPIVERTDLTIGRVILKSVSGDYLTRKGVTTEFN